MRRDAFSEFHPAVNFIFFAGAIGFGVVFLHPAYLLSGAVCAAVYYLLLKGGRGWLLLLGLLPLFLILTIVNPLFNTAGSHVLFHLFGKPYTAEALLYGGAVAGILVVIMLWFGCYNAVMTADKFTSLFGNLIPSVSLLLVMVFRMVPNLIRKAGQIIGCRRSVGKHTGAPSDGIAVLSALVSWVLEGSIITGDSMRSRGYGTATRSSFMIYRMTVRDWVLLGVLLALAGAVTAAAVLGQTGTAFTPDFSCAAPSWGLLAYTAFLLIPAVLRTKEAIKWHISRSKI